jgi:hypothetical protein
MPERFTASQWAEIEGGHEVTPDPKEPFSFIKEIHEARMTKDNGSSKKLSYTDCLERVYLILITLDVMRQYPEYQSWVRSYCKKTSGFESYKYYRTMGTDLYNFLYFIAGDDSAQKRLKDPEGAIKVKKSVRVPILDINRYIQALAQGSSPSSATMNMFTRMETGMNITNGDYKAVRRAVLNWPKINRHDKRVAATRLIFAVRAKLRSADIIDDFEKFAAIKNLEKDYAQDPEPTISTPDIATTSKNMALYRYLVGDKNIMMTRRFIENAKDGKAASANMVQAYMPAIEMLDDIVQAGPSFIQNLRALHKRAKNSKN